ncbi:MAG: hypothetical protein ACOX6D_02595 [Thermoguttaceae bacterium]
MESILIPNGETLTLGADDVFVVRQVTASGLIDGTGTLVTDCALLTGNIAPTVNIHCSDAVAASFDAYAVSATVIRIRLPSGPVRFDLRRREKAGGPWITVAVLADPASHVFDRAVVPNRVYEYQWSYTGAEAWSESNEAWTTVSYERLLVLSVVLESETAPDGRQVTVIQADPAFQTDALILTVPPRLDPASVAIMQADPTPLTDALVLQNDALGHVTTKEQTLTIRRNQTPTFVARISRPDGRIIAPTEIESITYTVSKTVYDAVGVMRMPVDGHVAVDVPLTALLEFPAADSFWDGLQTDEGLVEPDETVSGVRIVILESETSGEFDLSVYLDGMLIGVRTTNDDGIGATLTAVGVGEKSVTFNAERALSLYPGAYDMSGGTDQAAAILPVNGEILAEAGSVGAWANCVEVTDTARVRGYNFKHSPNTREISAFADPGTYEMQYRLLPLTGNPIVIAWTVEVL